jgi:[acyl-carrier-protein] S-malonyltransferase
MKMAWMFPGQGSQYPGMGRHLIATYPRATAILREAEAVCGLPLESVMVRGPGEALRRADVLEPALTALNIAYACYLREHGLEPDAVAGYSAGEVAALHCAGVVALGDALRIAALRGAALRDYAPRVDGRMAVILRVPAADVEVIVADLGRAGMIAIAARNGPDHTTIVGDTTTVLEAERRALSRGAEVNAVDVDGPWHCALVAAAAMQVRVGIREVEFHSPAIPVYCSASGKVESDPERLRDNVVDQMHRPVLWWPILAEWLRRGVRHLVEVGPGRFLGSIVKRASSPPAAPQVHFLERENGRPPAMGKIVLTIGS